MSLEEKMAADLVHMFIMTERDSYEISMQFTLSLVYQIKCFVHEEMTNRHLENIRMCGYILDYHVVFLMTHFEGEPCTLQYGIVPEADDELYCCEFDFRMGPVESYAKVWFERTYFLEP